MERIVQLAAYSLAALIIILGVAKPFLEAKWGRQLSPKFTLRMELLGGALAAVAFLINPPWRQDAANSHLQREIVSLHGSIDTMRCSIDTLRRLVRDQGAQPDMLRRSLDAHEECQEAWIEQATTAMDSGLVALATRDYASALVHFGYAIRAKGLRDTEKAEVFFERGLAYHYQGDTSRAISDWDSAVALDPTACMAWNNLSAAHYELRQIDRSKVFAVHALHCDSTNPRAWGNLSQCYVAADLWDSAAYASAQAIRYDPVAAKAWYCLGMAERHLGNAERALNCYECALQIQPGYVEAWYGLGLSHLDLLQPGIAVSCFDSCSTLRPDYYKAWADRGVGLERLGRYEDALHSYDHALKLNPDYWPPWCNKGNLLERLGRLNEAKQCASECRRLAPMTLGD